jgi:hypothetical protein
MEGVSGIGGGMIGVGTPLLEEFHFVHLGSDEKL